MSLRANTPKARPGVVTAAAVLAFVAGGLFVVLHLWTVLAVAGYTRGGVAPADAPSFAALYLVLGFRIAAGALYIWGGIAALRGSTRTILVIAAVLQVILAVVVAVTSRFGTVVAILDLLFAVPILVLILQPSATNFFRARRTPTN
ncbi:hypothetical protein [Mycobacterium szulgai]|uniref:Integral membrane protein n=1 Tax=Mycobacterium szulgai TaxID=1787 RepID=A0A1X2ECR5_MYCSZ|nr:hypothetical protein [Mycobacterium szulgai]MCV7076881.1 hypothetical protein [Mycobacterium szulgai]ORW98195.1 hypothetical protein AWC27_04320 [Mycobacterium szulgai]